MLYFDWLWFYKLDDTKENFVNWLVKVQKWEEVDAIDYANTFYY